MLEAKISSQQSSLGILSKEDRTQKKLQDAIQNLKDTKERNEKMEKELEVLSESAQQYVTELRSHVQYADYYQLRLTMMECRLDVSELACGFEDFVERRRLKKEAGRGDAALALSHEWEERRWKKKLEKAGEELREAKEMKQEQKVPPLEMDRMLLILDRDLDAREIRKHEERLKTIVNNPGCCVCPEEFYISPANITRTEYKRNLRKKTSTNDARVNKDTWARFKKPKQ
ncbi:hypothetical protein FPANT_13047, partial [Fusarium pseudoanthophilum]